MYAIFLKDSNRMVKLADCKLVDTEQQAQWYCVLNPQYTYRQIKKTTKSSLSDR